MAELLSWSAREHEFEQAMLRSPALLILSALLLMAPAQSQCASEMLLTPNNAYNPIPSPDGKYIAYVRTGWGRPSGSGGFGRSLMPKLVGILVDPNGWLRVSVRIRRIMTGYRRVQQGSILSRCSNGSQVRHAPGQRNSTRFAHTTKGGLQSNDTAKRGGHANRTTTVL